MIKLFFSYCHRDETMRDELEVHLSALKRQGTIESWHDRRIIVGEEWAEEIDHYLNEADIILLLVSPYFIASDYCYNIEMARAMERHEKGETRVIPVILEPCRWQGMPFGKLQAVPTDGKPISKFPNLHDAFLEVVQAIEKAVETDIRRRSKPFQQTRKNTVSQNYAVNNRPRSSNLGIRKHFTDHDRDTFLEESFEYIANFFENSLDELRSRNPEITTRFKRFDSSRFTAIIYREGTTASECRISLGGGFGSNNINYSHNASNNDTSINEYLSVIDDGHALLLEPLGMPMLGQNRETRLSQQGAAEYFWGMLIQRLQM